MSHVHSGALGWVAMISFGAIYHMLPILWKREKMYSVELVNVHFWLATVGIVLYITSMWTAGITQGLMWRSYDNMGFLKYSFLQSVIALHPYYVIRAIGGIFFLSGALVLVYNALCTIERIQKQVYNQPVSLAS
ncbi:MAG: cbb3-type cytochrome c oxidase subunit I [Candidatus Midichloria mitochondrii]|nr:cbb3-type cytochrome c oxidase subunit I [Candidatus Midichloria mitochondrii]MDJ1583861.1 cbb3-type cytochrome c oxidase subunit I [Candidatus Midichloria mitochondrii]